ncbi:MAG TPA: AAA family ATPase [Micromonosporaceae bacterium]|nr:AAA family ATPase [Micromonosporaceae bacterium]
MTSLSMVGHSDDLAEIVSVWKRRDRTRQSTVVITGAPGVGKSRLVAEALAALDPAPAIVLSGAARLHSPAPYDWLAAVLDQVGQPARGFGAPAVPPVPADALAWLAQEPDVPRERYAPDALLRIAVRVVRWLVGGGPAVLVAEDLEALDPASLNLLAALAAATDLPALLLVTSRSPRAPEADRLVGRTLARLTGSPGAVRVHLRPLSGDDVAAALTQIYPGRMVTDDVVTAAMRLGGSNPYRLTELLAVLGGRDPARLIAGNAALPPNPVPARRAVPALLTAREHDVLAGVAAGLANKQIARSLGISVRTVAVHVSNVLRKTGTASRTDAAMWAIRNDVDTDADGLGRSDDMAGQDARGQQDVAEAVLTG